MDGVVGDNRTAELLKPSLTEARFQPHNPSLAAQTLAIQSLTTVKQFTQLFVKAEKIAIVGEGAHTPPAIRDHISGPPW